MKKHYLFLLIGILFSVLIIPVHSEMVDIIDGSIDEKLILYTHGGLFMELADKKMEQSNSRQMLY